MNPLDTTMKTIPELDLSNATTVLASVFAEGGRLTTHAQGLSLGRRIHTLIDRGASVRVSLDGITEFHGPAVHSMLYELFSTFGVHFTNRKLAIVADRSAPYALGLPLHVSEATAKFREQEQGMKPEPGVALTVPPKPLVIKEPQTFASPLVKEEAAAAARVNVEKSQEPISYEVEMDEKVRVNEWEEFVRWANSGLGAKTPVEHEAAWKAWQLRASIQQGEIEYWKANTKAAKRNTVLALVWSGIAWVFAASVVFFGRK